MSLGLDIMLIKASLPIFLLTRFGVLGCWTDSSVWQSACLVSVGIRAQSLHAGLQSQHWGGRDRTSTGVPGPASPAELVSPISSRDPVSKQKV